MNATAARFPRFRGTYSEPLARPAHNRLVSVSVRYLHDCDSHRADVTMRRGPRGRRFRTFYNVPLPCCDRLTDTLAAMHWHARADSRGLTFSPPAAGPAPVDLVVVAYYDDPEPGAFVTITRPGPHAMRTHGYIASGARLDRLELALDASPSLRCDIAGPSTLEYFRIA